MELKEAEKIRTEEAVELGQLSKDLWKKSEEERTKHKKAVDKLFEE